MSRVIITSLRTDLLLLLLLAVSALGIGVVTNHFRPLPLPLGYESLAQRLNDAVSHISVSPVAARARGSESLNPMKKLPESLSLADFSALVDERKALILDARPALFYRFSHVPGALSLPREDFAKAYAEIRGRLESNPSQPIVVYCSDTSCDDSKMVRDSFMKLGYTNVSLFEPGWSAWSTAGKQQEH